MPECELRPATAEDVDAVYGLICELKQAELDRSAFHAGFGPTCWITTCVTSWPNRMDTLSA